MPPQDPPVEEEDNRRADKGGPNHTERTMGSGTQPDPVEEAGNQSADKGGPGHTERHQGDV